MTTPRTKPSILASDDVPLVNGVISRDPKLCATFVRRFTPIVRWRVSCAISRYERSGGTPQARQDMLDLVQNVFVVLLEREGRVLSAWVPDRGLSLNGFVALVAYRDALSFLRSGRRSAWAETPTEIETLDWELELRTPERQLLAREELTLVLDTVLDQLSPRGIRIFEALVTNSLTADELCQEFHMTAGALYSFKARLRKLLDAAQHRFDQTFAHPSNRGHSLSSMPNAQPWETLPDEA